MSIGTKLFTWLCGEVVGQDQFGNRYYRAKGGSTRAGGKERRWVIYAAEPEASRVPPLWHAWLHHTQAEPPLASQPKPRWAKEHEPNRTGTAGAYRPPGDLLKGGHRPPATGDYEPWVPS